MTLQEINLQIKELMDELRDMEVKTSRLRSKTIPQSGIWIVLTRKLNQIREIQRQYQR